jgi:hypothetical protein
MNALIINLARFGDILQTQAAVSGLAGRGRKVGMLCLDNFVAAAGLLENVSFTAALPGSRLLAGSDEDWRESAGLLHRLFREWRQSFPADEIINLTASLSGRVLARCLAGDSLPVRGFGMDEFGFGVNGNVWTSFLQGSTLRRLSCPYNLADVFRRVCGVGDLPAVNRLRRPDAATGGRMRAKLAAAAPCGHRGFVAFQLGASEERRRWPVEYFAALGDRLWAETGICPLILGSDSERTQARGYAEAARAPFVTLVGETSVPELAAVLSETRLLVSNDTGTMHLAAGLGVPVLALFLATAQAWDTGPYLDGSCCLEPHLSCHPCAFGSACPENERCRRHMTPGAVGDLLLAYLNEGRWKASGRIRAEARVWLSRGESGGDMGLRSLSGHEGEDRSVWIQVQRDAYRHILDGLESSNFEKVETLRADFSENQRRETLVGQTCFSRCDEGSHGRSRQRCLAAGQAFHGENAVEGRAEAPRTPAGRDLSREFSAPVLETLRRADALLHLMGEQGALLGQMPDERAGRRLLGSAARLNSLLEQCAPLNALGYLCLVLMQERGGSLSSFLECAAALRCGVRRLIVLLEENVEMA